MTPVPSLRADSDSAALPRRRGHRGTSPRDPTLPDWKRDRAPVFAKPRTTYHEPRARLAPPMRAFLFSVLLVFMLQGCGLKGPLYLPKPTEKNTAKNTDKNTESNQAQQKKDAQQQPQQDQQNQYPNQYQ